MDSVVIYDGINESSPILSDLGCDNSIFGINFGSSRTYLQSSGPNALLVFQSDESKAHYGFRILTQFRPGNTFLTFRFRYGSVCLC